MLEHDQGEKSAISLGLAISIQEGFRGDRKHGCAVMRSLAKSGKVWRCLVNPKPHSTEPSLTVTRVPVKVSCIHQSSGEGGWPVERAQSIGSLEIQK